MRHRAVAWIAMTLSWLMMRDVAEQPANKFPGFSTGLCGMFA
jgi:hypothetical protein